MTIDLKFELDRFRSFSGVRTATGRVDPVGPDILRFTPANPGHAPLKLGFLALVHGNEIIGLPILNSLLRDLQTGKLTTRHELYFGLGNVAAAFADKRFLEKDLNRCFGQTVAAIPEERRAREIEAYVLDEVDYLIDLHQTIHPAVQPFFIFQYSKANCFNHLSLMNPGLTTILQFDAIGDSQSLSTDEYVRSRGRFGAALELGQIGFTEEKFRLGKSVCGKFISRIDPFESFAEIDRPGSPDPNHCFFEIAGKFQAKADATKLDARAQNFLRFEAGETIGESAGQALLADQSGFMLFPKANQLVSRGVDLFHVCRHLSMERLRALAEASDGSIIMALPQNGDSAIVSK